MRTVLQDAYGPPDRVLSLREVEAPTPGPGEVLLRVRAAGVNWADGAITCGVPYVLRLAYGPGRPRERTRGMDVAGIVESLGPGVDDLVVGDEVFGWSTATFAELALAPAGHLVQKPASLSFEQAAGTPMAGFVALQALRDVAHVQPGQRVLVNGASGGIGSFAVQIGKAMGAEVTGVCSTPNLELVRSLGADHVLDYTSDDFTRTGVRYDCILDIADDRSLRERRRSLTQHGTLIPNSGRGNRWFGSLGRIATARIMSPFIGQNLRPFLSTENHGDLEALKGLIEEGAVRPVIGECYPLEETATAVERGSRGHARGKVVVVI